MWHLLVLPAQNALLIPGAGSGSISISISISIQHLEENLAVCNIRLDAATLAALDAARAATFNAPVEPPVWPREA